MHDTRRLFPLGIAALVIGMTLNAGTVPVQAQQNVPVQPAPAQTAEPAPSKVPSVTAETDNVDSFPELVIGGHVVMRLRSRAGGLTPQERAYSLRQRLGPILTLPNLTPDDVQVRQRRPGQTASIYVRQRLLMTVDRNLAQANNTSVGGLAEQWARNLRETLPQVNVSVRMSGGTSWGTSSRASAEMPPQSPSVGGSAP